MTKPLYHKNVKPPTKKKMGRKINGDLHKATSTGKKKKRERDKIRTDHGSLNMFTRHH